MVLLEACKEWRTCVTRWKDMIEIKNKNLDPMNIMIAKGINIVANCVKILKKGLVKEVITVLGPTLTIIISWMNLSINFQLV